jgi:hypothetical protein
MLTHVVAGKVLPEALHRTCCQRLYTTLAGISSHWIAGPARSFRQLPSRVMSLVCFCQAADTAAQRCDCGWQLVGWGTVLELCGVWGCVRGCGLNGQQHLTGSVHASRQRWLHLCMQGLTQTHGVLLCCIPREGVHGLMPMMVSAEASAV